MNAPAPGAAGARRGPWVWFAVAVAVVTGGMLWILATREPPPPIPPDASHADRSQGEPGCLTCHGVDGPNPRSKNHPLDQKCFHCH